jgi:hypothetical protein
MLMFETESFLVTPVGPPGILAAQHPECVISILRFAQHAGILRDWRALEANALEPNPFLSPDFLIPARSHLLDGADLGLALVWEQHDGVRSLTGLFPLTPRPRSFGVHWLRSTRAALWHHAQQPVGGALLDRDPDRAARAVAAFFGWLRNLQPRLSACQFRALTCNGPTAQLLTTQAERLGLDVLHLRDPAHTHGLNFRPKGASPLAANVVLETSPVGVRTAVERLICLDRAAQSDEKAAIVCDPKRVAFLRAVTRSFAASGTLSVALIDTDRVKAGGIIMHSQERAFLWWLAGPSAADPMVEAAIAAAAERQLGVPLVAATQRPLSGLGMEALITQTLEIGFSGRTAVAWDLADPGMASIDQAEAEPAKTQRI